MRGHGSDESPHEPLLGSRARKQQKKRLLVLHPQSNIVLFQTCLITFFDGSYTAFVVPFTVSTFQDISHLDFLTVLDLVAGSVFSLDIILRFNTAYEPAQKKHEGDLVTSRWKIAGRYLRTSFWLDFLSIVPAYLEAAVIIIPSYDGRNPTHAFLVHVLTVVRLMRVLRLPRLLQGLFVRALAGHLGQQLLTLLPFTVLYLLHIVYSAAVLINLLGCFWLFTAKVLEDPHSSWLTSVGDSDLSGAAQVHQYIAAVYYAMTTIATVGYGDIHATTSTERIAATLIMFTGVLFFGFVISSLSDLISHMGGTARRAVLLRQKAEEVEAWLQLRQVPRGLGARITAYFSDAWVRYAEEVPEQSLLNELPLQLRGEAVNCFLDSVFKGLEVFRHQRPDVLTLLASCLHPHTTLPGHNLSREGSIADRLWILQSGRIQMLRGLKVLQEIEGPMVFGEACIVSKKVRQAARRPFTFRAVTCCTLWQAHIHDLVPLLHVAPSLETDLLCNLQFHLAEASESRPHQSFWRHELAWIDEFLASRARHGGRDKQGRQSRDPVAEILRSHTPPHSMQSRPSSYDTHSGGGTSYPGPDDSSDSGPAGSSDTESEEYYDASGPKHGDRAAERHRDHDEHLSDTSEDEDTCEGDDRLNGYSDDEEHHLEHRIDIPQARPNQGGLPFQVQRRLQHP
ncbi:hypothetical protein WJX74_002162 [Apatococcus lobatus]|uniref:Cyclic nucleotide-binding domain-containing protein n=2 Tax=Apatococcus TaxID=904362 RepID=A0AAW1T4C3_9CHLO